MYDFTNRRPPLKYGTVSFRRVLGCPARQATLLGHIAAVCLEGHDKPKH